MEEKMITMIIIVGAPVVYLPHSDLPTLCINLNIPGIG